MMQDSLKEQDRFMVECRSCRYVWPAAILPLELDVFAKLLVRAICPACGEEKPVIAGYDPPEEVNLPVSAAPEGYPPYTEENYPLTTAQAAAYLNRSKPWLTQRVHQGKGPHYWRKSDRRWHFREEDLRAYMDAEQAR